MNDPVALLLVIGFIEWIQQPGYGARRHGRPAGAETGGRDRRRARDRDGSRSAALDTDSSCRPTGSTRWRRSRSPALAYGLSEVAHGSGLLAVYLTALALGAAPHPGPAHVVAFHEGLGWVAQIGLFILLGLLVFPSRLDDVALEGAGALGGADPRRPPDRDLRRHRLHAAQRAREGDARLGRAARGDADLARHLPGRRRRRAAARRSSRSSSSSSSPRPWSRARASSRWRRGWA